MEDRSAGSGERVSQTGVQGGSGGDAADENIVAVAHGEEEEEGAGGGVRSESPAGFEEVSARHIRDFASSVGVDAPQFMAAVMQTVASEMLQRAGDVARQASTGRIEPQHILQAVQQDGDLSELVGPEALEEGGLLRPSA